MQQEFGAAYVQRLRASFPGIPGRADFCVYWLKKAHDHLQPGHRAGLVGTNTIRQNYSREGGLDYIVANVGVLTDVVSTQVWSGDAQVHVSIVNWIKQPQPNDVPKLKYLTLQRGDAVDCPWESFELPELNAALSLGTDVTGAKRLETNATSKACYQGQTHGHEGFLLTFDEATQMMRRNAKNAEILFPFLIGEELIANKDSQPERMVIDLQPRDVFEAGVYKEVMDHLRTTVLPDREKAAREEQERNSAVPEGGKAKVNKHHSNFLKRWWLLSYGRGELIARLSQIPRYIACSRVTKRPIFDFVSSQIRPNDALAVFPLPDDYSFGILQSGLHFEWFKARCSTLEERFRYTSDSVFDTFPWPQSPTIGQSEEVASAAIALRGLRREIMAKLGYSLRDLYRTLEEPGANPLRDAHDRLDSAVRAAYAMPKDADPLAFLLALNLSLAAKEKAGEPITPPGIPVPKVQIAAFVTDDCIRVNA